MKALIHVTLKSDVLDPQGKAIQNASAALGYDAVKSVRSAIPDGAIEAERARAKNGSQQSLI